MRDFDNRRARYVPVDVFIAFDEFGTKLIDKWGMEGVCGWILLLAACKREVTQGLFTYSSEAEAWSKLGATATGYTLDEFFRYTGQCKKTRKTRQGRVTYVTVHGWEKWNTPRGGGQKPSKDEENTEELPENTEEFREITTPEVEVVVEGEVEEGSEVEAEASDYTFSSTTDIEAEVQSLLKLGGADRNSEGVLRSYVSKLPLATVADIRIRAREGGKRVGWAVNALKDEITERSAA